MTTGKWAQAGVPHKGWVCEDIEDAGAPDFTCQMCEVDPLHPPDGACGLSGSAAMRLRLRRTHGGRPRSGPQA